MIDALLRDQLPSYESEVAAAEESTVQNGINVFGLFTLESSKGTLSAIVNKISSGNLYVAIYSGITNITQSPSHSRIIFIVVALLIYTAFFAFVSNIYKAIVLRIFLEARTYGHVPVSRFLFLLRVKKYIKSVCTMFLVFIFQTLWDLTIIGGIIKHYSYIQVPFIVAENPDINPIEAIRLSRRMMNGLICLKIRSNSSLQNGLGLSCLIIMMKTGHTELIRSAFISSSGSKRYRQRKCIPEGSLPYPKRKSLRMLQILDQTAAIPFLRSYFSFSH